MKRLALSLLVAVSILPGIAMAAQYPDQATCTSNCSGGVCTYIAKNGVYQCSLATVNSAPSTNQAACQAACATACNLIPAVPNKSPAYYQCPASTAPTALGTCAANSGGGYTCTMSGSNTTAPSDGGCQGSGGGHTLTCTSIPSGYTDITSNTTAGAATPPATAATPAAGGSTFVPLTSIPGLTAPGTNGNPLDTSNLANFFNGLYKICIGAAAVLAILEITLGGFKVMSGDSITAHSEGRDQIMGAVLGLVLVLSPFVIFSVINPCILSFSGSGGCSSLNSDLAQLQAANTTPAPQTPGNGAINTGSGTDSGNANPAATSATPSAPTNLTVTSQTDTTATLSWTAPTGTAQPSGYDVYNGSTLVQSVTGTSATITGLSTGQKNEFTVKAHGSDGTASPASNNVEVVTVTPTSSSGDGSEGAWVASEWQFIPDNGFNAPPVNCWKLATPLYPVPYLTNDKTKVGTVCTALFGGDTSNTNDHVYSCTFIQPGQAFTPPAAPGTICSLHTYTCPAYTPPGSANACN